MICLIASAVIFFQNIQLHAGRNLKLGMQLCCILLLASDIAAWIFRGQPGTAAYYMVRISNFLVFFINFIYMSLFSVFLWESVAGSDQKFPKRIFCIHLLSLTGIVLLIASQFLHFFYYFDAQNTYHRGSFYPVTQLLALLGIVLNFSLLIQFRKQLERSVFYAFLSYFILPLIATLVLLFHYGLSLQNLALVTSTQIMFFVDMLEVSQRLEKSQRDFLRASFKAEHDAMTGLWNKPSGMRQISDYLSSMGPEDHATFVFIDIDDFKHINDTYGHAAGDYWITEVSQLLTDSCRKDDIVCRFGGDEFLVFFKNLTDQEVLTSKTLLFNRFLQLKAAQQKQEVHCSLGICRIYGAGHTLEECIECADRALYEAKGNGKNGSMIHNLGQDTDMQKTVQNTTCK